MKHLTHRPFLQLRCKLPFLHHIKKGIISSLVIELRISTTLALRTLGVPDEAKFFGCEAGEESLS